MIQYLWIKGGDGKRIYQELLSIIGNDTYGESYINI
jgi:hypothetical protein